MVNAMLPAIASSFKIDPENFKEIIPEDFATAEEFARVCWGRVTGGYEEMRTKLEPLNQN